MSITIKPLFEHDWLVSFNNQGVFYYWLAIVLTVARVMIHRSANTLTLEVVQRSSCMHLTVFMQNNAVFTHKPS